jgi:restriction system protein
MNMTSPTTNARTQSRRAAALAIPDACEGVGYPHAVPVPTYVAFIEPLIRLLAGHREPMDTAAVYEALAGKMNLSENDQLELLPSGRQAVFKNRIGWAHDRLKRSGYAGSPKRGLWQITEVGSNYIKAHPKPLKAEEIGAIADVSRDSRLSPGEEPGNKPGSALLPAITESPDERIAKAVAEVRDSVRRDLLERIGQGTPVFFENLVLELLHEMGYGASKDDVQRVGGPGDEGIDGVISLDRLGLEKVYVQAKRWKGVVRSPDVQGFMGALQLQGATKGVFITTSTFTKDATEAAAKARGTIVLLDGRRLADLMMDYGIGTTHRALKIPKVDGDYFEEG